jgi:hypothetical protein
MKPIPAEQIIEGLSEDLQDLVVREAFVRHRRAGLVAGLAQTKAQEAALKEKKPGLFGGKGAKDEHEAALAQLRANSVAYEGAIATCDAILEKTGRIIGTEIAHYFATKSDDFRKALAAQKIVPEWEKAVALYLASLKGFIAKLGVARNQMSSGYDRKANKFAPGALEAFAAVTTAAKTLETEAMIPNRLAKQQREALGVNPAPEAALPPNSPGLPYLAAAALQKQAAALSAQTLDSAQTKITALIEEAEKLYQGDIPGLVEGIARERAGQEAEQRKHADRALDELRAMADGNVDPAQSDAVFASMEARFGKKAG